MATKKATTGKKKLMSEKKVKVRDLPERNKELNQEHAKEVKGGIATPDHSQTIGLDQCGDR